MEDSKIKALARHRTTEDRTMGIRAEQPAAVAAPAPGSQPRPAAPTVTTRGRQGAAALRHLPLGRRRAVSRQRRAVRPIRAVARAQAAVAVISRPALSLGLRSRVPERCPVTF